MEFQIPYTNWMWLPKWKAEDKEEPCLVYFRKVFWLKEKVTGRYEIEISADSRYKLYVNGELAEIGPSKGDRMKWYYDTVDISPYVKKGENCIAVEVLRYPMMGSKGNYGIFRTETPGLYVKDLQGMLPGNAERKHNFLLFPKIPILPHYRFWRKEKAIMKMQAGKKAAMRTGIGKE